MNDLLEPYESFDAWTKRTGILDGSGLTWVVRLPLNVVIILVTFLVALVLVVVDKIKGNGRDKSVC